MLALLLVVWLPIFGNRPAARADQQVVVLRNGNVLEGDVTRQAAHVIVRSERMHIRLASADVELVAPNLETAYRHKSLRVTDHDTTARCQLIRWCVRHGLKQEAMAEIQALQRSHPHHPQLEPLRKLVDTHRSDWKQTILPHPAPLHPDRAHLTNVRDRLSKASFAQFVHQVQPLLLNRCGQASCHGPATDTSYELIPARRSMVPRGTTQRNLGATLRRIGAGPPSETLLWMSAQSPHGPLSTKPLEPPELDRLLAWIEQVSTELAGPQASRAPKAHPMPNVGADSDDVLAGDPFDPAGFNDNAANAAAPPVTAPRP